MIILSLSLISSFLLVFCFAFFCASSTYFKLPNLISNPIPSHSTRIPVLCLCPSLPLTSCNTRWISANKFNQVNCYSRLAVQYFLMQGSDPFGPRRLAQRLIRVISETRPLLAVLPSPPAPSTMATDAVQNLQDRIFGRAGPNDSGEGAPAPPLGLRVDIPKPENFDGIAAAPNPPPKFSGGNENETSEPQDVKSYRERLALKLGEDYEGVERYRLVQDERKDKHWKRWGPYLSDRQWVRFIVISQAHGKCPDIIKCLGYCQRGLLC